jgi:hypothetical protein
MTLNWLKGFVLGKRVGDKAFLFKFERYFGHVNHVGIELELPSEFWDRTEGGEKKHLANKAVPIFQKLQIAAGITEQKYLVLASHGNEIQVLFDIKDPMVFRHQVMVFVAACKFIGFPTTASVHVNVQAGNIYRGRVEKHGSFLGRNVSRFENKFGPSFREDKEFLANLLIAVTAFGNAQGPNYDRATRVAEALNGLATHEWLITPRQYAHVLSKSESWGMR